MRHPQSRGSRLRQWNIENNQCAAFPRAAPLELPLQDIGALPHGDKAQSAASGYRHAHAVVLHLQPQMIGRHDQPYPGIGRFGVPHHVIQGLLQNSIDMNGFLPSDDRFASLFLISYNDPGLFSELRHIPLERFLQTVVVKNS